MITSGDCAIGSSGVNTSKLLDQLTKEAARWMVLNVAHTIEESFLFTKSQWMSDKRHSGIKRSVLRVPHCTRIQTYIYTYIRTTNTHTHSHTHIWNVRMHAYTAPPHSTKSLCERRNRAHWKNYGHCELNECIQWRQLRPILLVPILGARSLVAFGSLEARRSMSFMYTNYTHWKLKKKNRCEMGFASSHTSSVIFFFLVYFGRVEDRAAGGGMRYWHIGHGEDGLPAMPSCSFHTHLGWPPYNSIRASFCGLASLTHKHIVQSYMHSEDLQRGATIAAPILEDPLSHIRQSLCLFIFSW